MFLSFAPAKMNIHSEVKLGRKKKKKSKQKNKKNLIILIAC